VVLCGSGYRSSIAASLLQKSGITGFRDLTGGMQA
jgi:rhodanese-related sulfurtransferase